MSAEAPSIYVLMSRVMADIGAVDKRDFNQHQKFNFRGIDALHNAVYGPLCKHGVFVVPEVLEAHYAEVKTSSGKDAQQATLRARFTFYGPAGDSVSAVTAGEAMDSQDKATNKAMAAAFKYALLQTFCIPTEDQDDADAGGHDRQHQTSQMRRPTSQSASVPDAPPATQDELDTVKAMRDQLPETRRKGFDKWLWEAHGAKPDAMSTVVAGAAIEKLTAALKPVDAA